MDEFGLISSYFAPLARGFPGSLNLGDDAALVSVPAGRELVITTDAISEGVHFIGSENPELIAKKLLRTNLSDLAAMGATPLAYFLALMLPKETGETWIARFADGLREDQEIFSVHLAGGDTTATLGTLSLSATALGTVAKGAALRRNGAQPGDHIYVSGTLGDAALGLLSLQATRNNPGRDDEHARFLVNRYCLPEPRLSLGQKLHGIATAAMDVSDGLVQDLGHICAASGVGATIERERLPLSTAARSLMAENGQLWEYAAGGGDDYELLFTAAAGKEAAIADLARELNLPLTKIGTVREGKDVKLLDASDQPLALAHKGFRHFDR